MTLPSIQNEVLTLSEADRVRLMEFLWDSLSTPEMKRREEAWAEESERRIEAVENGSLSLREGTEVFDDMRRRLKS